MSWCWCLCTVHYYHYHYHISHRLCFETKQFNWIYVLFWSMSTSAWFVMMKVFDVTGLGVWDDINYIEGSFTSVRCTVTTPLLLLCVFCVCADGFVCLFVMALNAWNVHSQCSLLSPLCPLFSVLHPLHLMFVSIYTQVIGMPTFWLYILLVVVASWMLYFTRMSWDIMQRPEDVCLHTVVMEQQHGWVN